MNSSAAEQLCSFSRIPWYPVDIWSIVSSLSQWLRHLSKGSILLTLFPMNSFPSLSFSHVVTPGYSMCSVFVLWRHWWKSRGNFYLQLVPALQLGCSAAFLPTCTCWEGGSMEESVDIWEIWPWCFPSVHNQHWLLIFLLQFSRRVLKEMAGLRVRYYPVAMDPTATCPIAMTPKCQLRDLASVHQGLSNPVDRPEYGGGHRCMAMSHATRQ